MLLGSIPAGPAAATAATSGIDVSSAQPGFDWPAARGAGVGFAFVKATEGTSYRNPQFAAQYNGSYQQGMIRGAYHFARPDGASGAAQAEYFVRNGGGWSRDGRTLPGALDLEDYPHGVHCYGRSPGQIVAWIHDFVNRYHDLTGRWAVIYTGAYWWNSCTAGDTGFAGNDPLWLVHPAASPGTLPAGWPTWSFWQNGTWTIGGRVVDHDLWNGTVERLRVLACGGPC
jgi:GH25 family lysozyme M1 (1,4-beta-N-acetylmuramidase)